MSSPAKDIADLLSASDVPSTIDLTLSDTLFVNIEPNLPKQIVTVFDSPGGARDARQDIYNPAVMIRAKALPDGYQTAYQLLSDIIDFLHGMNNLTIGDMRYLHIIAASDINVLGRDENNRPVFSVNFDIKRAKTT